MMDNEEWKCKEVLMKEYQNEIWPMKDDEIMRLER